MAFSGAQITRLGLAGITRGLYGSFADKEAADPPVVQVLRRGGYLPPRRRRRAPWKSRDERERAVFAAVEQAYRIAVGEDVLPPSPAVEAFEAEFRAPEPAPDEPAPVIPIDVARIAADIQAVRALIDLARERDEEAAIVVLLL